MYKPKYVSALDIIDERENTIINQVVEQTQRTIRKTGDGRYLVTGMQGDLVRSTFNQQRAVSAARA